MRYFTILLFTLLTSHISLSCTCEGLDSTNVAKWIGLADFVVEGEYLTNLSPDSEILETNNRQNGGFDVLFRVTSVIKGTLSNDTIAIVQFDNGNCMTSFMAGKKYIVLGDFVKRFVCDTTSAVSKDKDQIPVTIPPPPSYVTRTGTFKIPFCYPNEESYWNSVSSKYLTLYTASCTTFYADSESGRLLRRD